MQDGCKVYMDSYINHVSWSPGLFFKIHLLVILGLAHSWETMALKNLTTGRFMLQHFIMSEDPVWIEILRNNSRLRARSHMTSSCPPLEACDHTTWFWKCLLTVFGHFFWALVVSWSRLLSCVCSGSLVEKAEPAQVHFTRTLEGPIK